MTTTSSLLAIHRHIFQRIQPPGVVYLSICIGAYQDLQFESNEDQ